MTLFPTLQISLPKYLVLESSYHHSIPIQFTERLIHLSLVNHTSITELPSCLKQTIDIQQCPNIPWSHTFDLFYVHLMMAYPKKGAMPLQWSSLGVIQVVPSGQHPMLDTTIIQQLLSRHMKALTRVALKKAAQGSPHKC